MLASSGRASGLPADLFGHCARNVSWMTLTGRVFQQWASRNLACRRAAGHSCRTSFCMAIKAGTTNRQSRRRRPSRRRWSRPSGSGTGPAGWFQTIKVLTRRWWCGGQNDGPQPVAGAADNRFVKRLGLGAPLHCRHQNNRVIDDDPGEADQRHQAKNGQVVVKQPMTNNAPTNPIGIIAITTIGRV